MFFTRVSLAYWLHSLKLLVSNEQFRNQAAWFCHCNALRSSDVGLLHCQNLARGSCNGDSR